MTITRAECELFATTIEHGAASLPDPLLADWLREHGRDDLADKLVGWWVVIGGEPELPPDKRIDMKGWPITLYRHDTAVLISELVRRVKGGEPQVRQATANEVEHGVPYDPDAIKIKLRHETTLLRDRRSPHTARTNPGD